MDTNELKKNVGLRVKTLRNSHNHSQEFLAGEFKVSKEKISRIERGLKLITDDILVGLCDLYNVSPSYFFIFPKANVNLEKSELIKLINERLEEKSIRTLKKLDTIISIL